MKSYEKIEDFLEDKSFKQWVLYDDPVPKGLWLEWLAAHPSHVELVAQARTILLELDSVGKNWDSERQEKLLLKITGRINSKDEKKKKSGYPVYIPYSATIEKRVKAFIAVSLCIAFFGTLLQGFLLEEKMEPIALEDKQDEWIVKSNPKGQKSIVQLADGSKVILNAESGIRYRSGFGEAHRDIYLEGEAFFEVASGSLLPFRVHSGELVTTALGTSFNINSYKEGKIQVQLATGKVRVHKEAKEAQSVYLVPGEEVMMGLEEQLTKNKFDPNNAFHWKNGILLFKRTPFQEAVVALERWYAVEVTVKNLPSKDMKVSGEFKNTYLKDVLESLGYAYGFDYSIKNEEVLIQFKTQN